jgi:polyisoprenoid-binding protein YceI
MKLFNLVAFVFAGITASTVSARVYEIDQSHTNVGFAVKHLVFSKVRGRFDNFKGTVDFDDAKKTFVSATGEIETNSVNTNNADRDKHLRSKDFFDVDVAANKLITYKLDSFKVGKKGDGTAKGTITIKNVSKPIELKVTDIGNAKDPWGNERLAFVLNGKINRKDFGILWNKAMETGGVVVGDEVEITIEVEAIAKK